MEVVEGEQKSKEYFHGMVAYRASIDALAKALQLLTFHVLAPVNGGSLLIRFLFTESPKRRIGL